MDKQLASRIDAYVDEVWEDAVEDIRSLVRIRSVEDTSQACAGMPWGSANYEALTQALAIASRLGLEAHDCEGYLGYADLAGASDVQVATIAHSDVVPEGLGWTVDPFDVTRREGYLLGRGVIDDKGPLVLSLYAAHFFVREVQRTGKPLPYTLRCLVGSCEETTMADVDYYLEHYDAPAFCFTPDADFPLICGEKGIFHGQFVTKEPVAGPTAALLSMDAGTVANAIPGLAGAVVSRDAADFLLSRCTKGIESEELDDGSVRVMAHGVGGHAAFPEGTENAIGKLVRLMLSEKSWWQDASLLSFLQMVEKLTRTSDGSALGIDARDDVFGALTLNAGVVRTRPDGTCTITVDVRYPSSITSDKLVETFNALAAKHGCVFTHTMAKEPFYMDPELPAIKTLLDTYREYSGDADAEAFVIGGGTYARHFPRACAFGPHNPAVKDPAWVGSEHGPDEGVSEEVLRQGLRIYIMSIARLMELDLA